LDVAMLLEADGPSSGNDDCNASNQRVLTNPAPQTDQKNIDMLHREMKEIPDKPKAPNSL